LTDPAALGDELADLLGSIPPSGGTTADWIRAGTLLRRAGAAGPAGLAFGWAARRLALEGKIPQAAGLVKAIQELAPGDRSVAEAVARLYAHRERATRGEAIAEHLVAAVPSFPPGAAPEALAPVLDRLAAAALAETATLATSAPPAGALPSVPFFARLSAAELRDLVERSRARSYRAGEEVVRQGETGTSFFVVTAGRVSVTRRGADGERPVELGRLGEAEVFGELGFFSGAPRTATVTALEPLELLEIEDRVLGELLELHPTIRTALEAHGRERLLGAILDTSPLFASVPPGERRGLLDEFERVAVAAGEVLIETGRPGPGFFVILSGEIVVTESTAAATEIARLGPGDFFGEIGSMTGAAATATCTAARAGELFRLPRARFTLLAATYPPVLEVLTERARHRIASSRARGLDLESDALARAGLL